MAQKAAAIDAIRKVPNWIDGEMRESATNRFGDVFDSATGERCAEVVMSDEADVAAAVGAAHAAFESWSKTPVLRRARVMFKLKELIERDHAEIAALITQEHGKVLHDAAGSVQRGLEVVSDQGRIQRPGRYRGRLLLDASTGWRLRWYYAVQFPRDGAIVDVPYGNRLRQYFRAEAVGEGPGLLSEMGGAVA
jgi:acyl-CoA reductase-like NAD-dependent aldehyde dehydrogenase